jgi:enoyl-CoA hydratase/carnithine racemase
VERDGAELQITLDRPEVRNAYDAATRDHLVAALQLAVADRTILRVALRGNGPAFCSGGDLDEFGSATDHAAAHLIRTGRSAAWWLHRCSDKVTAHLHGACVGAGIELPAFAGRVCAAADTRIQLPEVGMGLVPGAGGTASIPRRIGRHRSAWMAITGAAVSAATALTWGLVDELDGA